MGDGIKGSIGNPYSQSEFESLLSNGLWEGGFVQVGELILYYFPNGTTQNDDPDGDEGSDSGCDNGNGYNYGSDCGCGCGCGCDDNESGSWHWYDIEDENVVDVEAGSTECTLTDVGNLEFDLLISWTEGKFNKLSGACTSVASVIVGQSRVAGNENQSFEITYLHKQNFWLLTGGALEVTIQYKYRLGNSQEIIESSVSGPIGCFSIPEE